MDSGEVEAIGALLDRATALLDEARVKLGITPRVESGASTGQHSASGDKPVKAKKSRVGSSQKGPTAKQAVDGLLQFYPGLAIPERAPGTYWAQVAKALKGWEEVDFVALGGWLATQDWLSHPVPLLTVVRTLGTWWPRAKAWVAEPVGTQAEEYEVIGEQT